MKLKRTNYYLSGHSTEITLTGETTTLKGRLKCLGNKDDEILSSLMDVGFANWATNNKHYKQLLNNLSICEMSNEELYNFLMLHQTHQENSHSRYILQVNPTSELIDVSEEIMAEVVRLRLEQKWSIQSLQAKFQLSKIKITNIFKIV